MHKYLSKYYARCNKCNTYSAPYDTPEAAAAAWNTRACADRGKTPIYLCDREANTECTKSYCVDNGGECRCTLNVVYALKDDNGEPIYYDVKEGE